MKKRLYKIEDGKKLCGVVVSEKANVALGLPNLPIMVGIVRKYLKIRICYSSPPCRARRK